ncbi:MAG: ion channel [Candidatus Sulfopaludibacter sp.]|nr:ion channel [Candidatus Sulfopaludibacter sp.]
MQKVTFDPGLTQQFTSPFRRVINQDGSFNVHRRGTTWRDIHPYMYLINMGWVKFFATLVLGYFLANLVFAGIYFALGPDQLSGADSPTAFGRLLNDFFFSSHTLSTVGYGNISPKGIAANSVAAFEALVGVLAFAVATGLLFGRVSRPSARIGFSDQILMAPYQDGTSLQFRVVNRRTNDLMDLDVRMMLMTVETKSGKPSREYNRLKLERDQLVFIPLTWTIVHPIDSESPLFGKTEADLKQQQAELLIVIKAYDDTFSQMVVARHSYRYDEIVWGRRFSPAFFVDEQGDMVLELPKLGELA